MVAIVNDIVNHASQVLIRNRSRFIDRLSNADVKLLQIATLVFGCLSIYEMHRKVLTVTKWVPISLSCTAGALHFFLHEKEDWDYKKIVGFIAAALFALHAFNLISSGNKFLNFAKFQFASLIFKVQTSSNLLGKTHYQETDVGGEGCPVCWDPFKFIEVEPLNGSPHGYKRLKRLAKRSEDCLKTKEKLHWVCIDCMKRILDTTSRCPECRKDLGLLTDNETPDSIQRLNLKEVPTKVKLSTLSTTLVDSHFMSLCVTALVALKMFNSKDFGWGDYNQFIALSLVKSMVVSPNSIRVLKELFIVSGPYSRHFAGLKNDFSSDHLRILCYTSSLVLFSIVYYIYTKMAPLKKLSGGDIGGQSPCFSFHKSFGSYLIPTLALVESYERYLDIKASKKEEYVLKLIPAILALYTAFSFYKKNFSWMSVKVPLSLPVPNVESATASLDFLFDKSVLEKVNGPFEIAQFLAEKVNNCVTGCTRYRHVHKISFLGKPVGTRQLHLYFRNSLTKNCTLKGVNLFKFILESSPYNYNSCTAYIGKVRFKSSWLTGAGYLGHRGDLFIN